MHNSDVFFQLIFYGSLIWALVVSKFNYVSGECRFQIWLVESTVQAGTCGGCSRNLGLTDTLIVGTAK